MDALARETPAPYIDPASSRPSSRICLKERFRLISLTCRAPEGRRMNDLFEEVQEVLSTSPGEYEERVERQVEFLRRECDTGALHNPEPTVGLEMELYCVDRKGRLARIPYGLFDRVDIAKELGLHNAEVNTDYALLDEEGFRAQFRELSERLWRAEEVFSESGLRLVSDGMWVIPPAEGSEEYLGATDEVEGIVIASNAAELPRYHSISNVILERTGGSIRVEVPGFSGRFQTILPEALTTSIQPHHQVPDPADFPLHFNYSIRLLGPMLALSTNSPFLPSDLYAEDVDPREVAYHELRIQLFEQSINTEDDYRDRKVRVPDDLHSPDDVFEQIRADETIVPMLAKERGEMYEDSFFEFNMKRGTFWRWTRPVIGGETRTEANLRLEFRPLPSQPTLRDTVGLQALFSGALLGLVGEDHPLVEQDWSVARDNFYAAAEGSLDAEQRWIDREGDEVRTNDEMYGELFDLAESGLRTRSVSEGFFDQFLSPLKLRVEEGVTPSVWRVRRTVKHLHSGEGPREAMEAAQRDYLAMQEGRLFDGSFADCIRQGI